MENMYFQMLRLYLNSNHESDTISSKWNTTYRINIFERIATWKSSASSLALLQFIVITQHNELNYSKTELLGTVLSK